MLVARAGFAVLAVALAAGAHPASAKVAYPPNCEVSPVLVGSTTGAALPSCGGLGGHPGPTVAGYRVVARDAGNVPLAFHQVFIDFSQTSIRLLADDRAGTTVDCARRTISRITDGEGVALFAPRLGGACPAGDVVVHVEGATISLAAARSTDVDADGTTGLFDFARVARNFLEHSADPATDLDPCAEGSQGRTTLADFAVFGAEFLRGAAPGSTVCP